MAEANRGNGTQDLGKVIESLRALSGDIESCAVLGEDGTVLYSTHPAGVERERVGAMLAALWRRAGRLAREQGKEHAVQARVKTGNGHLLLVRLEGDGALAATTGPDARVGLALYDMRSARGEVEGALAEGEG